MPTREPARSPTPPSAEPGLLRASFYQRPTEVVAQALLGKVLIRRHPDGSQVLRARIVEVEAYLGERDQASHARRGPTPRAAIMFGPPGRLYVYLVYGMHHCMNFVTESDGQAGAVLIRAAEPVSPLPGPDPRPLAGPGKLCAGLGITLHDKGLDVTMPDAPLVVVDDGNPAPRRARSARIGVDYAGSWARRQLRFFVRGNPHVSGPRTGRG